MGFIGPASLGHARNQLVRSTWESSHPPTACVSSQSGAIKSLAKLTSPFPIKSAVQGITDPMIRSAGLPFHGHTSCGCLRTGLWVLAVHVLSSVTRHPGILRLMSESETCKNSLGYNWQPLGDILGCQNPSSSKTRVMNFSEVKSQNLGGRCPGILKYIPDLPSVPWDKSQLEIIIA